MKKDGNNFEMTFYEEQPVPRFYQPPPAAHHPAFDLDQFRDEMRDMVQYMAAGLIRHAREQVAEEAANNTRRLLQEIDALKERIRVLEHRSMNKRPEADQN